MSWSAGSLVRLLLASALVFGLGAGAMAAGSRSSNPHLTVGSRYSPPFAFIVFCVRNPGECRTSSPDEVVLDNELMATLQSVNRAVNRSIRPRSERGDVWRVNVSAGDCEDYALTKRSRLIAAGFPPGALRIAIVRIASGEGHAVLVVKTDQADLVLDNRTNTIRPWNETGLRWVAMSGANPRNWTNI